MCQHTLKNRTILVSHTICSSHCGFQSICQSLTHRKGKFGGQLVSQVISKLIRSVHLIIGVNICGSEVDDDVNNEHDVHYKIHDIEGGTGVTTGLHGCFLLVTKRKYIKKRIKHPMTNNTRKKQYGSYHAIFLSTKLKTCQ